MKRLSTILVILLLANINTVLAQRYTIFSQYMFNGLVLNPAYAGSHEALSVSAFHRGNFQAVEASPQTQTFSIHSPLNSERVGLGMNIIRDKAGVTDQLGAYLVYAYKIPVGNGNLSLGLQGGFINYKSALNILDIKHQDDGVLNSDIRGFLPSFGTGIYYSGKKGYLGFSAPQLLDHTIEQQNTGNRVERDFRHYFATGGFVMNLSPHLKLKPNGLLQIRQGEPLRYDINANLLIDEVIWVGASYKSINTMALILDLQLANQLRVGYSYDFGLNNSEYLQVASHEFALNYLFSVNPKKVVSPRYF
jgi:type IX secretion system PorP/SprF family membrane protein